MKRLASLALALLLPHVLGATSCTVTTCIIATCDGQCIDTSQDPAHCGGCGHACQSGQSCNGGMCQGCATGTTTCGESSACTDTMTDAANCGGCNQACPPGASCAQGMCACPAGKTACSTDGSGACVPGSGAPCTCSDGLTDKKNCGMCGNVCPSASKCDQGKCSCLFDKTVCGSVCVDKQTDVRNCGSCGHTCNLQETCTAGACVCTGDPVKCACPQPQNGGTCDVSPQCGCGASEGCYPDGPASTGVCEAAGAGPVLATCTKGTDCQSGTLCILWSGYSTGLCKAFCQQSSECNGDECIGLGDGNGGTVPGVSFCGIPCNPTNPADTQGHQACPAGIACVEWGLYGQDCTGPAGSSVGSCQNDGQCASGHMCLGQVCKQMCFKDADCGATTCDIQVQGALSVYGWVGSTPLGICN